MIVLSWLYVKYGKLPPVNNALYVLKPAVLGIIAAGIIKLGRAAIRNIFLAILLVGAFIGMRFGGINFLLILLIAGALNLLIEEGWPRLKKGTPTLRSRSEPSHYCFRLLIRVCSRSPGCFLRQVCSVLAARMPRWYSCSAEPSLSIAG